MSQGVTEADTGFTVARDRDVVERELEAGVFRLVALDAEEWRLQAELVAQVPAAAAPLEALARLAEARRQELTQPSPTPRPIVRTQEEQRQHWQELLDAAARMLQRRRRDAALRARVRGVIASITGRLARAREHRGPRRTTLRRSPARSPDRDSDPPPARPREVPA
jgi:hypothetical protein